MRLRVRASIRWKMTLLYSGLLAVLLAAFGLYLYLSVEHLMIGGLTSTLHARYLQAQATAPRLTAELRATGATIGPRQLPALESLAGPDLFLQLRDPAGRVVAASANLHGLVLPPPQRGPDRLGQGDDAQIRLPATVLLPEARGSDITVARFEVRSGPVRDARGQVVGLLQVAQSLFAVDDVQDKLVDVLVQGMAVALCVAVVAGVWLAGHLLRPIAAITATARRIGSSGDLAHRITVPGRPRGDEVGQLAATFNAMLDRLEGAFAAQRRFVADAGHELKTPLTAILGQANLVRRRGTEHPELIAEATAAIIDQAERLHRLTRKLLDLATVEESQDLGHEMVPLSQVTADVARELAPLAAEKAVQVRVTYAPDVSTLVWGDRDRLEQLIMNLVDNALTFTPAGGQVRLVTRCVAAGQQAAVVLEVQDSGSGIADADLPHIFERFYRADKARSRARGSTGLGLAIVQEVARQHGGRVEVESVPGRGATFRVWLPAGAATGSGE